MMSEGTGETQNNDAGLNPNLQPTPYPGGGGGYRRRPIVVRDPKTGVTKFVHGGPGGSGSSTRVVPSTSSARGGASRYDDGMDYDDAPVVRVVNGYRGKQIVVRDPSRGAAGAGNGGGGGGGRGTLGVRDGGVRKSHYYDRRMGGRSPGYSPERYEDRRGRYYDDDEEDDDRRMYKRGGDYDRRVRDYDRGDVRGGSGGADYERDYYNRNDGVQSHEDLTGKVVYVDNLSDDVTTTGLADLFGMVGAVKELRLLYDRQGNPNGSADIVFQRRVDAEEAIKSLDNVPLNNRPMKLSMGNGL